MSIYTPGFLGVIIRKNERTKKIIGRETDFFLKHWPGAKREYLNEDPELIGFSVAMNGRDLGATIDEYLKEGAIYGVDFVATESYLGVKGEFPKWLVEVPPPAEYASSDQPSKWYALAPDGESK